MSSACSPRAARERAAGILGINRRTLTRMLQRSHLQLRADILSRLQAAGDILSRPTDPDPPEQ
jgi:hypothetical protein